MSLNDFNLEQVINNRIAEHRAEVLNRPSKAPEEPFVMCKDSDNTSVDVIMTQDLPIRFSPVHVQYTEDKILLLYTNEDEEVVIRDYNIDNGYLNLYFESTPRLGLYKHQIDKLKVELVNNFNKPLVELLEFTKTIMKNT